MTLDWQEVSRFSLIPKGGKKTTNLQESPEQGKKIPHRATAFVGIYVILKMEKVP